MASTDRHKSKQIHVWISEELYDQARELVDMGDLFVSMAELIRRGMQHVVDEYSGYSEMVREEIAAKHGPNDMGAWLYTGTCYVRVNARWQARYGPTKIGYMIDDINDNPMPHTELEAKYGTTIEIVDKAVFDSMYSTSSARRTTPSSTMSTTFDDAYKDTWAYKQEHGLL